MVKMNVQFYLTMVYMAKTYIACQDIIYCIIVFFVANDTSFFSITSSVDFF
jgi:hypothetical protein